MRLIQRVDQRGCGPLEISSRLGRNFYGTLDKNAKTLIMTLTLVPINPIQLSPRSCFLAKKDYQ